MPPVAPFAVDLDHAPDAGHTVREYAGAIWRRKGLVVLLLALGAAGGWWQGQRSPDVYGVATSVDIQKPKPFGGAAPTQAFGESYHESQLYYPTKWSLLSSGAYVERLFAFVDEPGGRRYPMWDWLTWPVYLATQPGTELDTFGPAIAHDGEFEKVVGLPAKDFARRYSFRRYGIHPSPTARYDEPSDLAGYLANRLVVKPEKGTTLVSIELEGEEREALAPLLNLLVEVFWREQRSETQRRLERERKFWALQRRVLGRDDRPDDAATIGAPDDNPKVGEDQLAIAWNALEAWKTTNGSSAEHLALRSAFRREQVVEGEARLRELDDDLVLARPDLEALLKKESSREIEKKAEELFAPPSVAPDREGVEAVAKNLDREGLEDVAKQVEALWLTAFDEVEKEAAELAESAFKTAGVPRLRGLPFVTSDASVAAAEARLRALTEARSGIGEAEARKGVVAAVREAVLRRARELRILLGRRLEVRVRLLADIADLKAQWTLTEGLKAVQRTFDEVSAQLAKVDAELERIRAQISMENDARPLKVIQLATDPARPVKPNRPLLVGLGAAVGLLLGLALALGIDWLDDTVSDPDDVARHVGAPVVGSILSLPSRTADRVTSEQPRSPVAEAFRAVRTSLEFSVPADQQGGRVFLVSSCSPREGKTTVASNLAIVLAQDGKRTLLIDADLRKPRVHEVMGVDGARGLSNVLVGRARPEDVVLATAHENLWVLPAGTLPPNPAELLGRPAVKVLFDALRTSFDRIVVDTAPVGIVTDAAVLARVADTVLLVVAAGRTKKRSAEHGAALLSTVGSPATGVIMNMVARGSRWAYGGYYDRGARGYYGSGSGTGSPGDRG